MELKDCVMQRYATKKFDGKKIPEKKVDELLDLVRFAPSALNLQPWKIRIVTDQKTKEELRKVSNDQEQVTTCSHLLVFCADSDYDTLIQRLGALMKKNHVPDEVIGKVTGMAAMFAGSMAKDQRAAWSQAQTYLALGNALNGAKALGFDSCPMGGFDPAGYTRILKIPGHLVPVMLCPIGYAADTQGPKIRYERDEIVF
ncbi:nitroreductase family protein [Methanoregula sp. UBA64]|uniref:nitroreductase family protein n=1 Tax=Methanoregula sp. UBA64 TaxID=1915554 RepID=UPI0025D95384|nr:NAD(P)H-dependent oxidoreductase [Methanoregula sp. UBA64]